MERATYFHVRRILGFSRSEFDDLAWHDRRMYLEQLAEWLSQGGMSGEDENDLASLGFGVEQAS